MAWAEAPSPAPGPVTKGLTLPRFRITEASRDLAQFALSERDVPGAVVVVIAVDDRRRALDISSSVKQQFEPHYVYLKRLIGNRRLYALMQNPRAMDTTGLGLHNYGCFYPSSAPPP